MIHPVVVNPVLSPVVRVTDPVRWRAGKLAPQDAILHWDADIDAFSEQTGGVHTFNHAVLSPQYQLNADGSYSNVGAKPAVDTFDGKKWLRSCGAVQNLLTNSVFSGAVSGTPGTAPTGWSFAVAGGATTVSASGGVNLSALTGARHFLRQVYAVLANTSYTFTARVSLSSNNTLDRVADLNGNPIPTGSTVSWRIDGVSAWSNSAITAGEHVVEILLAVGATAGSVNVNVGAGAGGPLFADLSVTTSNPQLTATAYPLPYVPTTTAGPVTQPASNATTTNGSWFTLPDGSPLWQALTGSPLTLATRVRMGVGSGDLAGGSGDQNILASRATSGGEQFVNRAALESSVGVVSAYDGTISTAITNVQWQRNAIIRRVTQVNTAATQFRVGYMIEGTHTAIQWSSWVNYDSSFNPSTLYRLMLGYNNAYPMWFNKITAWKKQVTDAEILESMA